MEKERVVAESMNIINDFLLPLKRHLNRQNYGGFPFISQRLSWLCLQALLILENKLLTPNTMILSLWERLDKERACSETSCCKLQIEFFLLTSRRTRKVSYSIRCRVTKRETVDWFLHCRICSNGRQQGRIQGMGMGGAKLARARNFAN